MNLPLATMDENAGRAFECGGSSSRLSPPPLAHMPYEPKADSGSCCHRTQTCLRHSYFHSRGRAWRSLYKSFGGGTTHRSIAWVGVESI